MNYSVIIPIYGNEETIPRLLDTLSSVVEELDGRMEAVFVVDGSPDQSFAILKERLEKLDFPAQLLAHSRNFGSFAAIRTGLKVANGEYLAVLSADLQEPPELILKFFKSLSAGECDVAVGVRSKRDDPLFSGMASRVFWRIYRRFVLPDIPVGGVDIFGCNRDFRDHLLKLEESRSSLVALIFWLGGRRKTFEYDRLPRLEGKSGWTFGRKLEYMNDSIFAFSDLPVRLLTRIGSIGLFVSIILGLIVVTARVVGLIDVPGYTMTILVLMFFGTLNLLAIGIVGSYAWRAYENSKKRPQSVVAIKKANF
jgi:glycosyltransferase involved in cell wall biosynthesis